MCTWCTIAAATKQSRHNMHSNNLRQTTRSELTTTMPTMAGLQTMPSSTTAMHRNNDLPIYCGVNAHFKNGVAERAIWSITEQERKVLLHAMARCPESADLALCPCAMRHAVHVYNTAPVLDGISRLELFSGTQVGSRMRDHHTFGCPVFILDNALAPGKTIPRWSSRARLGLNLGLSPFHVWNVFLILNLNTGLVSLQFHYHFDDFFETTQHNRPDITMPSVWKQLEWLRIFDGTPTNPGTNEVTEQSSFPIMHQQEISFDVTHGTDTLEIPEESVPVQILREILQSVQDQMMQGLVHEEEGGPCHAPWTNQYPRDFYGDSNMLHYIAASSIQDVQTEVDLFHDYHLGLQDRTRDPIAFHACRQCLHQRLQCTETMTYLLWCQCPFQKWCCRVSYLIDYWARTQSVAACNGKMPRKCWLSALSMYNETCCACSLEPGIPLKSH